ncbi:MAG: amidohydrolase family protein [Alphaproteobacteria bacterium]|nr:amidohydrolase family protein [Alphaproteobacteria bacterium]
MTTTPETSQPETTVLRAVDTAILWDAARGSHAYHHGIDIAFTAAGITHCGPAYSGPVARDVDARGLMVMPGLVNVHAHPTSEPMNKGILDELGSKALYMSSLYEFMPLFRPDAEGGRACVRMGLAELLKSGVTTVADLSVAYDGWLDLLAETGLRVVIAPMYRSARWFTRNGHVVEYEWDETAGEAAMADALRWIDRANQHPSGRLSGMVSPSQIDTCTAGLLRESLSEAERRNIPFTLHAAQSRVEFDEITRRHGLTPIAWLDSLGILGPRTLLGHGIFLDHHSWVHWPTRTDLQRLAETGTAVAHCPTVFSRRGIMLENFGRYRAAGVTLGIGTDTYPLNMLEEMRTAAIVARFDEGNAFAAGAGEVFHAATIGGATALGRDDIGRIALGAKADLVAVDLHHPMMLPRRDPLRSLIYVAAERAVQHVWVDGAQVVRDGTVLTIDYAAAADAVDAAQRRALERAPALDYANRPVEALSPLSLPVAGPH